ncbi:AMP-binding protein [Jiangella anatolica]|uniref:CoA ligase n=1 Tax=Jiangella anatolica TaxID=2670374 RepID=A0A2W2C319_9ACTN|nr:AMP-binding protein [Jiangella anatolica]PZF82367.1 CoA ligase [Jiangella anatolica]
MERRGRFRLSCRLPIDRSVSVAPAPLQGGCSVVDSQPKTVPELLARAAEQWPDREFLRFPDASITFAEAREAAERTAAALRARGLRTGSRVAIMLPNVAAWPITWLGTLSAGLVAVPVNATYREADLAHVIADAQPGLVVAAPEFTEVVQGALALAGAEVPVVPPGELVDDGDRADVPPVAPDALANLQYTSGTTGFPKACMLGHDYWVGLGALAARLARVTESDVTLTSQPFSYIDPMWNTAMALTAGIPLVVLPRFSASGFMRSVREHGVTTLYMLGTMPTLLLQQPPAPDDRDNALRLVWCSAIPPLRHAELEQRWGAAWREAYGLTESGVDLYVPVDDSASVGTGVLGVPAPGKAIRIVDADGADVRPGEAGELLVAGTPMMRGYWRRPEETARTLRDGWLHTGDLVRRDADGSIRLVGRQKDMIRRGGENVAAAEVEAALMADPDVRIAAVVPVPDELFGEEVKAVVVLDDGATDGAEAARALVNRLSTQLARFKLPRFVEFADELPMTPSARVAKAELTSRSRTGVVFDLREHRGTTIGGVA